MQIQINTDSNINGQDTVTTSINDVIKSALNRHSDQITRIEVHLSDQNSGKKGGNDDMRCLIEARMKGQNPISVNHRAETMGQAVDGAADKLKRLIDNNLSRLRDKKTRSKSGADILSITD